jgi:hypothetical protein
MHQYKTVTQILLILSVFNLVFGAPVVREIYDARDCLAVPAAVGNVVVMSKEQHQSRSDEATASPSSPAPDESTTSNSPPPPDGSATVHSLPLPQDGSQPLYASSPPPSEPTSSAVSSSSGTIVPATGRPAPPDPMEAERVRNLNMERAVRRVIGINIAAGIALIAIGGGWVAYSRHHHRAIDPDWYVSNPSHPSCRRLNVPNHKPSDLRDPPQLNS